MHLFKFYTETNNPSETLDLIDHDNEEYEELK